MLALGVAAYFLLQPGAASQNILISGAAVEPMGSASAVVLTIENSGAPDWLLGVESSEGTAALMPEGRLAVPTGTASLAMDAAHVMLMAGPFEEGALVPVTLQFAKAGTVAAKARAKAGMTMDHGSAAYEVPEGEPAPTLALQVAADGDGWAVTVETEGFTFSEEQADGAHEPGVGHGHLYVGDIKIGRLYGTETRIGALPEGTHEVRVTLNTNDHRSYVVAGQPVTASAVIVVD